MNTKRNIKKNYIFNLSYQLLLIIVPLLVTPYISRVLTASAIGQYSFSFSIITYFTLFASLGFSTYGQREIAKSFDKETQAKKFYEIIICRLFSVGIALAINIILCISNVYNEYSTLLLIMSINVLAIAFDIAFLYQGNEEFGLIVILNFITKIIGTICIFVFVKNPNDLWKYTLINSLMIFSGYLLLWPFSKRLLKKVPLKSLRPFSHLKGTIALFIPTIATSIYTVLDKTLIGVLVDGSYTVIENGKEVIKQYSDLENGFYEQSEKIIKLAMTVITCIGTVMIPRNSKEFAMGNIEEVNKNIYTSSRLVFLIGIPMVFGFIALAPNFVPWFYGDGYDKCIILISIFSSLILIIGFSNVFGIQYLLPKGEDKKYAICLILGAVTNLVLNIVFIKLWWSIGAAIASVVAELVVTTTMGIVVRKEINIIKILISSIKYIISGIIMFISLYFISNYFSSSILNSFILVIIGIFIYFMLLLILKDSFIYNFLKIIKSKLQRRN